MCARKWTQTPVIVSFVDIRTSDSYLYRSVVSLYTPLFIRNRFISSTMKGTIKGIILRNLAGIPEVRHPGLGTDARDSGLGEGGQGGP